MLRSEHIWRWSANHLPSLVEGASGSPQLSIQPWICAPGTHYSWVDRGRMQCGSLPDTSTHDQHWVSNPRPSDLEFNALSTWTCSRDCSNCRWFWMLSNCNILASVNQADYQPAVTVCSRAACVVVGRPIGSVTAQWLLLEPSNIPRQIPEMAINTFYFYFFKSTRMYREAHEWYTTPGLPQSWKKSGKKLFFQDHGKVREFCLQSVKMSNFEKVRENQSWSGNFLLLEYTYSSQICTKDHLP